MSQEETVIPGLGGGFSSKKSENNPYSRSSTQVNNGYQNQNGGTYVPGMQQNAPGVSPSTNSEINTSPVVGFLYSISRCGVGEFWPVRLGANTIGRSANCNIQLREMSVSDHHATLSVKQMKTTRKLIASIKDVGSKNGMYLNDEELDYDSHNCKHQDVITIGVNYKLLLLLIDVDDYGLNVAENFVSLDAEEDQDPFSFIGQPNANSSSGFNLYDHSKRHVDNGTVDLSGGEATVPGGTKFM